VVTLICDGGERYAHTYYDDAWLTEHGLDVAPHLETLEKFRATGEWDYRASSSPTKSPSA
jgi:cysteine synthase A